MDEKKEIKSGLTIYKKPGWGEHRCILNLDPEKEIRFNKGEKIEVTEEELKAIGKRRWLGVENVE